MNEKRDIFALSCAQENCLVRSKGCCWGCTTSNYAMEISWRYNINTYRCIFVRSVEICYFFQLEHILKDTHEKK